MALEETSPEPSSVNALIDQFAAENASAGTSNSTAEKPTSNIDALINQFDQENKDANSSKVKDVLLGSGQAAASLPTSLNFLAALVPQGAVKLSDTLEEGAINFLLAGNDQLRQQVQQNRAERNNFWLGLTGRGVKAAGDVAQSTDEYFISRMTPRTRQLTQAPIFEGDPSITQMITGDTKPSDILSKEDGSRDWGLMAEKALVATPGALTSLVTTLIPAQWAAKTLPLRGLASSGAVQAVEKVLPERIATGLKAALISPSVNAAAAASITEGAQAAGAKGAEVYTEVSTMPFEQLEKLDSFNSKVAMVTKEHPEWGLEQVKQYARNDIAMDTALVAAPLTLVMTSALSAPFEHVLAKTMLGQSTKSAAVNILKNGFAETTQEALQGSLGEQLPENIARKSVLDPSQNLESKLASTFAENAVSAVGAGVGGGVLTHAAGKRAQSQQDKLYKDFATNSDALGAVSGFFESKYDPAAISPPEKDGARNYGVYQFTDKGTLQAFLSSQGITNAPDPKTNQKAFAQWWIEQSKNPDFVAAQEQYLKATHYDPAIKKAGQLGFDTSNRAIQEMVWSAAIQHGPKGAMSLLNKTAETLGENKGNVTDVVNTFYDTRTNGISANFASQSEGMQKQLAKRFASERDLVLSMADKQGNAEGMSYPRQTQGPVAEGERAVPAAQDTPKTGESRLAQMLKERMGTELEQHRTALDTVSNHTIPALEQQVDAARNALALNRGTDTLLELRRAAMALTEARKTQLELQQKFQAVNTQVNGLPVLSLQNQVQMPVTQAVGPSKNAFTSFQARLAEQRNVAAQKEQARKQSLSEQALANRLQVEQQRTGVVPNLVATEQKTSLPTAMQVSPASDVQTAVPLMPQTNRYAPPTTQEQGIAEREQEAAQFANMKQPEVVKRIANGLPVPLQVAMKFKKNPMVARYIQREQSRMDVPFGVAEGQSTVTPALQTAPESHGIGVTVRPKEVSQRSPLLDASGRPITQTVTVMSSELKTEKAKVKEEGKRKFAQDERRREVAKKEKQTKGGSSESIATPTPERSVKILTKGDLSSFIKDKLGVAHGQTEETIARHPEIKKIMSNLRPEARAAVVFTTTDKAPAVIRQAGIDPKNVAGTYYNGKAYVFLDSHKSLNGLKVTLIHELGHMGYDMLLSPKDYYKITGALYQQHKDDIADFIKKERTDLSLDSERSRAQAVEEFIAHAFEKYADQKSMPAKLWNSIKQFFNSVMQALGLRGVIPPTWDNIKLLHQRMNETLTGQMDILNKGWGNDYKFNQAVREAARIANQLLQKPADTAIEKKQFTFTPGRSVNAQLKDYVYNYKNIQKNMLALQKERAPDIKKMQDNPINGAADLVEQMPTNGTLRKFAIELTSARDHNVFNRMAQLSQLAKNSPQLEKIWTIFRKRDSQYNTKFSGLTSHFQVTADKLTPIEMRSFDNILSTLDADYNTVNFFSEKERFTTNENGDYELNKKGNYQKLREFIAEKFPGTTPAAIDAIVSARKTLDSAFAMLLNYKKHTEKATTTELQQAVKAFGYLQNYVPRVWEGNHMLVVKDNEGVTVYRKGFDTYLGQAIKEGDNNTPLRQARANIATKKAQKLLENLLKSDPLFKEYQQKGYTIGVEERRKSEMQKLSDVPINLEATQFALDTVIQDMKRFVDAENHDALRSAMVRGVADVFKQKGAGKHLMNRKGVQGYERQDLYRHILSYSRGVVGYTTKGQAALDLHKVLREYHGKGTPNEYEYAVQAVTDNLQSQTAVDSAVGTIRGAIAVIQLGFQISNGLINILQTPTVYVPQLSKHISGSGMMEYMKSVGTYHKFLAAFLRPLLGVFTNKSVGVNFRTDELMQTMISKLPANNELDRATNKMITEELLSGHFEAQFTSDLISKLSKSKVAKVYNKLAEAALIPQTASESFNRITSTIAGFQAAYKGLVTNPKTIEKYGDMKGDYDASLKFAQDIVLEAHYDMSRGNMPQMFRGSNLKKAASLAYTFMKFTHSYLSNAYQDLRFGDKADKMAQLKTLAAIGSIAGLKATFPFMLINALVSALDPDHEDLEDKIRKWTGQEQSMVKDLLLNGGAGAFFQTDISTRMLINLPFLDAALKGKGAKDIAWSFLGVPTASVQDYTRMMDAYKAGEYMQAWSNMPIMPRVIRNMMDASRMFTDGPANIKGTPYLDPATGQPVHLSRSDAVTKMLGFQPLNYSKARELEQDIKAKQSDVNSKMSTYAQQMAGAIRKGDFEKVMAINETVATYNQQKIDNGHPELVIQPSSLRTAVRNNLGGKPIAKQFRSFAQEMGRYYGYSE